MTITIGNKAFVWILAPLILVAGAVIALVATNLNSEAGDPAAQSPRNPLDFLYIDGSRIGDYLAQLEGGKSGPAHRIKKEINLAEGGITAGGLKLGAKAQRESEVDSELIPTASSGLEVILDELGVDRKAKSEGVAPKGSGAGTSNDEAGGVEKIDLTEEGVLNRLTDGSLVKFTTRDLISPVYMRPYVVVRTAATLAALFPRIERGQNAEVRAARRRQRAKNFAKRVGVDPRITLDVDLPPSDGAHPPIRVLLPIEYKGLTRQRSVVEKEAGPFAGGKVTVVGKVIRVLRYPRWSHWSRRSRRPEFIDYAARESWYGPLQYTSTRLLNQISDVCRTAHALALGKVGRFVARHMGGRRCLLAKLRRQTELSAPGAVILPLAIYK